MQYSLEQYKKIDEARKTMLAMLNGKGRQWDAVACCAAAFDDKAPYVSGTQICHAGLNSDKMEKSIAVVSALMKPKDHELLTEEEAYMYLDWLLNRSPYASTFVTKDAYECLISKVVVSNSFTPANLMAAGLVASRRLWEYPVKARVMIDLVKAGVNENLAFYLGHITNCPFNREGKYNLGGHSSAHCSVNTNWFDNEALLNFMKGKSTYLKKPYHNEVNYYGYDEMHGGKRYGVDLVGDWAHNNFPYKPAEIKAANPFGKAKVGHVDKSCSYDHFIETMKTFQHDILTHIGYEDKK